MPASPRGGSDGKFPDTASSSVGILKGEVVRLNAQFVGRCHGPGQRGDLGIIAQSNGSEAAGLLSWRQLAHSEGGGFGAIPRPDLVVDIGDVTLHGPLTEHQRLGNFTISLTLRQEAQYLPLTVRHVRRIIYYPARLALWALSPGGHPLHQGSHAQLG